MILRIILHPKRRFRSAAGKDVSTIVGAWIALLTRKLPRTLNIHTEISIQHYIKSPLDRLTISCNKDMFPDVNSS